MCFVKCDLSANKFPLSILLMYKPGFDESNNNHA